MYRIFMGLLAALLCSGAFGGDALACSRVVHVYEGNGQNQGGVLTGRTMDWYEEIHSNIWAFPRGMQRSGAVAENPVRWTSKYGSVITTGFDVVTTDGLNEKGLSAGLLNLSESDYGKRDVTRPGMSYSIFVQYLLDNFASVDEAVQAMRDASHPKIQIAGPPIPGSGSRLPALHFVLSDASGDSAIFEFIHGTLQIYHSKDYKVVTNSPPYDKQLALADYWKKEGGHSFLPGSSGSTDRFVRGGFYEARLPKPESVRQAVTDMFSVMRNLSVPFGVSGDAKSPVFYTVWRTVADNGHRVYYFDSAYGWNTISIDLKKLDFSKGSGVKKLTVDHKYSFVGEVSDQFVATEPFTFAGAKHH
ncbi:MAG: linear amide C-N hydrolase [Desulfovibrio sp.]|uniref:linear amide C-N hydrolase n=1 Tax=Desulfovibrio sp. 7SRBS1 TaxID=3378064 RepID=UPI003B41E9F7